MKQRHLKYSLCKKGVISFIFSKLAFLIFTIGIATAFFYITFIQNEIQKLNMVVITSESIGNIIDMVSSSKFKVWIKYESDLDWEISFKNQSFSLNELSKGLLFPINSDLSEDCKISCLNITNINGTVIKKCQ